MSRPHHHTAQYSAPYDTALRPALTCCLAMFVVLCCSQVAFAQAVIVTPSNPRRWDVAGSVGWLAGNKSEIAEDWNDWYDTFATSFDAGYYWTPHLKIEAGIVFTNEGTVFSHREHLIPDDRASVFIPREHHFRVRAVSAAATYQFFENTWVHPFLSAGIQLAKERERAFSHDVPYYQRGFTRIEIPIQPPRQATERSVRPHVVGGAKFYVNERGFVRTDLGLAWDEGRVAQVTWRAGIGIDF